MTDAVEQAGSGDGLSTRRPLASTASALGAAVALVWVGGHVGFLGGAALVAALLAATPRYAFAVGQFALVAATAGTAPAPAALVVAEVLLFGILVTPDAGRPFDPALAVGTVAVTAGLGALAWASLTTWNETWIAAGTVLAVAGLIAYGVHRYELVMLGNVPASGDPGGDEP